MKRMIAAGRWPDDVEYDVPREGTRFEGEGPEPDPERGYHAAGETCGRCGRPIDACLEEPCAFFRKDPMA